MRIKLRINSPLVELKCLRRHTKSNIKRILKVKMFGKKTSFSSSVAKKISAKTSKVGEKNKNNNENRLEQSLPDGYSFTESSLSSFDEHMLDNSSEYIEKMVTEDFAQMTISPSYTERFNSIAGDDENFTIPTEIGEIDRFIVHMGLVTVKGSTQGQILKINTKVYVRCSNDFGKTTTTFTLLGIIDDVFGAIGDIMYSVLLSPELLSPESVKKTVYILGGKQDVSFLYVHCNDENKYCISSGKPAITSI